MLTPPLTLMWKGLYKSFWVLVGFPAHQQQSPAPSHNHNPTQKTGCTCLHWINTWNWLYLSHETTTHLRGPPPNYSVSIKQIVPIFHGLGVFMHDIIRSKTYQGSTVHYVSNSKICGFVRGRFIEPLILEIRRSEKTTAREMNRSGPNGMSPVLTMFGVSQPYRPFCMQKN